MIAGVLNPIVSIPEVPTAESIWLEWPTLENTLYHNLQWVNGAVQDCGAAKTSELFAAIVPLLRAHYDIAPTTEIGNFGTQEVAIASVNVRGAMAI